MKIPILALVLVSSLVYAKPKFPSDVVELIDRNQDCTHFAGEEPYNEERAAEIQKAMRQLKCASIEKEKEKLIKKYRGNGEIVKAIEFAD
jgi:hypothetical protein